MTAISAGRGFVALIDDEDAPAVARYRWSVDPRGERLYVRGHIGGRSVYLHRFLAGEPGMDVDHRNGDCLDNRRANLRIATRSENLRNRRRAVTGASSRFKGVSFVAARGKWEAYIGIGGRKVNLGIYRSEIDAARAYDAAAREAFGDFAATNLELGRFAA